MGWNYEFKFSPETQYFNNFLWTYNIGPIFRVEEGVTKPP